jgi:hypothetical protein
MHMDIGLYQRYLREYVYSAIRDSDGSIGQIRENLESIQVGRFLVRHREEKLRALQDARAAFDEHRHWPLEIILSHLGVDAEAE